MLVTLPSGGQCFAQVGQNQYWHFIDSTHRDSYFLVDGKLVKSQSEFAGYDWQGNPNHYTWNTYNCLNEVTYKSEIDIYFNFISFGIIIFTMILLYKIILARFIK